MNRAASLTTARLSPLSRTWQFLPACQQIAVHDHPQPEPVRLGELRVRQRQHVLERQLDILKPDPRRVSGPVVAITRTHGPSVVLHRSRAYALISSNILAVAIRPPLDSPGPTRSTAARCPLPVSTAPRRSSRSSAAAASSADSSLRSPVSALGRGRASDCPHRRRWPSTSS